MSRDRQETVELLKKRAIEVRKGFEEEIDRIIHDIEMGGDAHKGDAYRETRASDEDLQEYEKKLEGLKDELKRLKKIKKQQKKINKLEEEREDVINKIEEKREMEKRLKGHKKR